MEDVEDERLHLERVAALDIGKAGLEACVRVPAKSNPARRAQEVRSFGTTKKEILSLAAWLREHKVEVVVMESTSDYWKPPFFRLEAEGFTCQLLDAKQVKALPGRPKTDKADCVWLAKVAEKGMAPKCFVPPEEIRRLRTLTRYRRHLTEERSREKARAEKLLEDALLKLSVVVSDLHGVSSRQMMEALIAGNRDPKVLAQMARGRMRSKIRALEEALDGADTFSDHHAFVLRMMLDNIDRLSEQVDKLTAQIEELIAPFERQVAQLDAVPGLGRTAAQDLIAEASMAPHTSMPTTGPPIWSRYRPGPQPRSTTRPWPPVNGSAAQGHRLLRRAIVATGACFLVDGYRRSVHRRHYHRPGVAAGTRRRAGRASAVPIASLTGQRALGWPR